MPLTVCLVCLCVDGLIFAVNGFSTDQSAPLKGFVINYSTKDILDTFNLEKMVNPKHTHTHTIDINTDVEKQSEQNIY